MRCILQFLLISIVFAGSVPGQTTDSAVTAVVHDGSGRIWAAARVETGIVCFLRAGEGWRPLVRIDGPGILAGPALAPEGSGMVCAWLETAGEATPKLKICRIGDGSVVPLTVPESAVAGRDLALAPDNDGGLRLLLTGEKAVESYSWSSYGGWQQRAHWPVAGTAVRPVILADAEPVFAWEERANGALAVAVSIGGDAGAVLRFPVIGFAGEAIPALQRGRELTVFWQERDERQRARIVRRGVSAAGLSEVAVVPTPPGFGGIAAPRAAVNDARTITAYGWFGDRWAAVRLGEDAGETPAVLATSAGPGLDRPFLVSSAEGGDLWISGGAIAHGLPRSARAEELKTPSRPRTTPREKAEDEALRVLCFGDSITYGTTGGLGDQLLPGYREPLRDLIEQFLGPVDIVAFTGVVGTDGGWPGEKTPEGLLRLPSFLESYPELDYVLLLEGTNDHFWTVPLTIEESAENVGQMADLVRAAGAIPVVGTMLPRAHHPSASADARAFALNKPLIAMAQERGLTLAHFHTLFPMVAENYDDPDGRWLHPSSAGYEIMAGIWMRALGTFRGDFDRDGTVTPRDVRLAAVAIGLLRGAALFMADCDVDDDGRVNITDLATVIRNLGRSFVEQP